MTQISKASQVAALANDIVSVKDFGAVGDGVTDDTAAIQAALDSASSLFFPNTSNDYKTTSTLFMSKRGQRLYGETSSSTTTAPSITLDAGSSDNTVMEISAQQSEIFNLNFKGKGTAASGSFVFKLDEEGVDSENNGDVDVTFQNCSISNAETLISMVGRGLVVEMCTLAYFTYAITLDWPTTFVAGANPDQKLSTGMRSYKITGNRFHAGQGNYIIQNIGSNAANLHGLLFSDNYIDTLAQLFKGHLNDSIVTDNVIIHTRSTSIPFMDIQGGSDSVISNNNIYGMDDNSFGTEYELLSVFSLTDCSNFKILGNSINRVNRDVIAIGGASSNLIISGNTFRNVCSANEGGVTKRSIARVNAAVDGLLVTNNIVDISELSKGSWLKSEIVQNTGGYVITNHDIRGNLFDSTYWNLHNFSDAVTANIVDTDRRVIKYIGNGSDPQITTLPFKPLAVMAFNLNTNESFMVSCFSAAGASTINLNGYDVEVSGTFNTNLSDYYMYVFQ